MKEHGMELSLSKTTNVPSNETPTPTRLLRTCDALGLFQDLDPFTETFKRALENTQRGCPKTSNASFLSKSAGDDLHTPQLFLEGSELQAVEPENGAVRLEEVVVRSEADTSIAADGAMPTSQPSVVNAATLSEDSVHVLFEMPNGTVLQLSAKPVRNEGPQAREAIRIAPAKSATSDAVILTSQCSSTAPTKQSSANPLVKEKLKAFLDGSIKARSGTTSSAASKAPPRPNQKIRSRAEDVRPMRLVADPVAETEDERKRKILERNRRAASRSREKRKRHVENIIKVNKVLTEEVNFLRAEVVRLQTLLESLTEVAQSSIELETVGPSIEVASRNPPAYQLVTTVQQRNEGLRLDIAKARENEMMDLDSPSIVRCEEVLLSSAAPPSTPDEQRMDPFSDLERDISDQSDLKQSTATTVIQLNPNVMKSSSSV